MKHTFEPLSPAEEDLMEILWAAGRPYTSVEILEKSSEKSWSGNYLHKLLRSLLKKTYIAVVGTIQYNTQYARQFAPALTKQEFYGRLMASKGIYQRDLAQIAVCIAKENHEDQDNHEWIDELEEMIETLKQKDE